MTDPRTFDPQDGDSEPRDGRDGPGEHLPHPLAAQGTVSMLDIAIAPHPLRAEVIQANVEQGCTLRDLGAGGAVLAFVDGARIDDLDVVPRAGQTVLLKVVPQGGSDSLRLIASIAVIVVASLAAPGIGTALGIQTTTAFAAATLVGQLAVSALIPPAGLSLDRQAGLSPFRGVQRTNNRIAPYEVVPKLYGTHRLYPPYAALPVPVARGGQQDFLGLYCVGYRELQIDDASFKLGETPLANFTGAEYRVWDYTRNQALDEIYPLGAVTDSTAGDLKDAPNQVTRTTEPNTTRFEIDAGGAPIGFFHDSGYDSPQILVPFKVEYRVSGSSSAFVVAQPQYIAGDGGTSTDFPAGVHSNGRTVTTGGFGPAAFVRGESGDLRTYTISVGVTFPAAGQYEVRITRLPSARVRPTTVQYSDTDFPNRKWRQEISLIRVRSIVGGLGTLASTLDPRFAYVALKLQASDQLSGAVEDFNLQATGVVPVWNGTAFVMQANSSPAWAYRDVLLGNANGRPVSATKIDDATLIAWAASCAAETPPREFNGSVDGLTTVFETLKAVASAGRAAFSMRDGKYSVVRDVAGKTPVQLFTPRNMWAFSATKTYTRLPHALKMKFHDRAAGWIESERVVYADGYSKDGSGGTLVATLFESVPLFGCTDARQAFKDGRYNQGVGKLRPESFTWRAAIEHLVCQRGDVVRLQHDAILVGLGSGRITALDANTITLDERVLIESGKTYQVRIRRDDASSVLQTVSNAPGETQTLTLSGGVSAGVKIGDIASFGESGLVAIDVLITAIEPGPDLTATLRAVAYSSPGVHNADQGAIPPYDPVVTPPQYLPPAPVILNIDSSEQVGARASDGSYTPRIFVSYAFGVSETLITGVELQFKTADSVNWFGRGIRENNGSASIDLVDASTLFDLRLRGVNDRRTPGPWTEVYGYLLETARVGGEPTVALQEQRNNPATPNRDLSTIVVTVTPPTPLDPTYSHAYIDYRRPTDASWIAVGPTDTLHQARIVVNSDGSTYEVRARAVNTSQVISDFGATAQITVSTQTGEVPVGDPDAGAISDAALNVANLRVLGQLAAVTTFNGADASIEWNAVVPPVGQTLRDYRVRVINPSGGAVLRVRYVVGTRFTYFLSDNQADLAGAPSRSLTFEVVARTTQGKISASAASKTISNPAPALPGDFTHSANENTIVLRFTRPTDGDYVKARVYLSATNGFAAGAANLVYDGPETAPIVIRALTNNSPLAYNTTYYYRVELFDQFGAGALSAQFSATTGDIPGTDSIAPTVPGTPVLTSTVQTAALFTVARLDATATAATDANPLFYEWEVFRTAEPTNKQIERTASNTLTVSPVTVGVGYSVRVRAIDYSGNASAFSATATHTVAGDVTAPANVTGASGVSGLDKVTLTWTNPTDADFLTVLVYRGTTAGFTANGASLKTETRSTGYVDADVVNGTAYYYKFATRDVGGNTSAVSAAIGPFTPNQITSANVGNYIAAAALQAAQVGFDIGGGNLVSNSSFDADSDNNGTADSWVSYNNSSALEPSTLTRPTTGGVGNGAFQRVTWAVNNTSTKGLHQVNAARGGWAPNSVYVLSFFARASGTNVGKATGINWNTQPIATAQVSNPPLTTEFQRYVWRITWGASVEASGRVYFGIAFNSGSQGDLDFDQVQIEKGDVPTAYAPRPDEILPGTITTVTIADDAITAPKIIAGAIVAGKIAANAVEAGNVAANAITTRELTVGDFTNLVENASFQLGDVLWDKTGAWTIISDPANAVNGGTWVARRPATGASQFIEPVNQTVTCVPGDVFYATATVKVPNTTGGATVGVYFLNAAGTFLSGSASAPTTSATYTTIGHTVTAPANAVRAYIAVFANTNADVYLGGTQMFRVAGTALIQNAAIITAKINDLAVTNAKIDNLAVTNAKINDLDAVKITAGFIAAARIQAGTITADKLNVTQLSAITADLGSVTAGTVTGATVRTAASGARAELTTASGVRTLNSGGVVTSQLGVNGAGHLGAAPGAIQWSTAGAVSIAGNIAITAGNLAMSGGSIYGGKTTYASTTAGYWLGFDAGAAKFHIGNSTDKMMWDGTNLIANNIKTATSGQRVVLTAGNETEFYDDFGTLAASIGIKALGSDNTYILSGSMTGNATQTARIGISGQSSARAGVYGLTNTGRGVEGRSNGAGSGVYGSSASGAGVVGVAPTGVSGTGTFGVFGSGSNTGGVFEQINNGVGGALLLKPASSVTVAPTHTAESGTLCVRYIGAIAKVYIQTAGGFGGTGSTWVVLGTQT